MSLDRTGNVYVGGSWMNAIRKLTPIGPPKANDDAVTTTDNNVLTGNVLGNDTGYGLGVVSVLGETQGRLTVDGDGKFSYTAPAGFEGTETFSYVLSDFVNRTDEATVTITVTAVPVARADIYVAIHGDTVSGNVLTNDTPAGRLEVVSAGEPAPAGAGYLTVDQDGTFVFTPEASHTYVTFDYTIRDPRSGRTSTTGVTIKFVNGG